jgi:hypothetical protein
MKNILEFKNFIGSADSINESYEPDYKALADQLEKSMSGLGTDFDLFGGAIGQIENAAQYDKLKAAFGKREGQDLETWISSDFFGGWEWTKYIQPFYRRISRPTPPGIQSFIDKHGK